MKSPAILRGFPFARVRHVRRDRALALLILLTTLSRTLLLLLLAGLLLTTLLLLTRLLVRILILVGILVHGVLSFQRFLEEHSSSSPGPTI